MDVDIPPLLPIGQFAGHPLVADLLADGDRTAPSTPAYVCLVFSTDSSPVSWPPQRQRLSAVQIHLRRCALRLTLSRTPIVLPIRYPTDPYQRRPPPAKGHLRPLLEAKRLRSRYLLPPAPVQNVRAGFPQAVQSTVLSGPS